MYARARCNQSAQVSDLGGDAKVTFDGPYSDDPNRTHSVTVNLSDIGRYGRGAMIQDAFPYLSIDDREFLQTGISPEGWDKMFNDSEDEQEDE